MTKEQLTDFYHDNFIVTNEGSDTELKEAFTKYLKEEISVIDPEGSYNISIHTHKFCIEADDKWFEYSIYNNNCSGLKVGYNSKDDKYIKINLSNIDMFTHGDKVATYIYTLQEIETAICDLIREIEGNAFDADINIDIDF